MRDPDSPVGLSCFWEAAMGTWVFYVDESGDSNAHHVPVRNGETPLLALTAVPLPLEEWRNFDRDYLRLKRNFFGPELERSSKRAEIWEAKGNELTAPRNRGSHRRRAFLAEVLSLVSRYNGRLFSVIFLKNDITPVPAASMYTMGFQYLAERFSIFLSEQPTGSNGIIIFDSKMDKVDWHVTHSHMTDVFGNETGRQLVNILEAPLAADSRLTAGLQIADNIGSAVYGVYYARHCASLQGAHDYSHVYDWFGERLKAMQFVSRDLYDGHRKFGYRLLDHRAAQQSDSGKVIDAPTA